MAPKWVALQSWQKLQVIDLKKKKKKKKKNSRLFVQIRSLKRYPDFFFFFKKRMGLEIFNFCWFSRFRKIVLHNKNINKTRRPEIKKTVHCFEENYLTNHLAKFLQDRIKPWKVGVPRVGVGCKCFN